MWDRRVLEKLEEIVGSFLCRLGGKVWWMVYLGVFRGLLPK